MNRISSTQVPPGAAFDTTAALHAPTLDAATVDFYLRRGRHERARAFAEMIRAIFSAPAALGGAEVHPLPVRGRDRSTAGCHGCTDRAA